ncbi:MAG: NAD(P)/FAD-dependent oxidoreductase [Edaphobacter sp.]|uniref:NAD(P)/FAD-dependent oxidoreductase n=1 Tax=Edaphobacter sp. TaxID=1934404 RepID=UPI002384AB65|nr:NAD(P)/FAD-dependent oxidoreductase [Edaphobacter sp.]MDE1177528.1 NAD(P)/FAD-dependent oxidoreductase [Edaphobacter sp.]
MTAVRTMHQAQPKHVVIIGAGFAGLACAKTLATNRNLRITVIDKNNYHQFQPLLYQVATGILSTHNAAFNLRALLQRHDNIHVKMSEIVSVDLQRRRVTGRLGDVYDADYLVLAAGAEPHFFGVPGAEQFAFPLYSLDDAESLRSEMIRLFERTELPGSDRARNLNIVIVGSGATGVETAGALADLMRKTPQHLFSEVQLRSISLTVIDHGSSPLRPFLPRSQAYAKKVLEQRGVQFHLGESVQEVTASEVVLASGQRLPAQITIWAGGSKAARLSSALNIPLGAGGRIDVQEDLSLSEHPGVYVLGDLANSVGQDGKPLPQLGSVAKQAGEHCAQNILATVAGRKQEPFHYVDKGIMAMVGQGAAITEIGKQRRPLYGMLAFTAWQLVHVALLPSFRIGFQASIEWAIDFWGTLHLNAIVSRSSDRD